MAIDRIGKGAPPATPETGAPAAADKAGPAAPFKVDRHAATTPMDASRSVQGTDPASPLGRLRAGEVDVHGYVDLKVEEATKNLKGLAPAELDDIKSVLRDQLLSDPGLTDLVHMATGKMPSPPEE